MARTHASMSTEQIERELSRIDDEVQALKDKARELHAELNRRTDEQAVEKALAGMTDEQRAALLQRLSPAGVASDETFGIPGA